MDSGNDDITGFASIDGDCLSPLREAARRAAAHLGSVAPAWRADPEHAGRRLRALREAAGCSQQLLAARSGVSSEAISRLEHGRRTPHAATIRALAEALGVAPELFVSGVPLGLTLLTAAEAARRLEVPVGRVGTWLRSGALEGRKVSGRWRILAVSIAELAQSGRLRGRSRRLDPRYRG